MIGLTEAIKQQEQARREYVIALEMVSETQAALIEATRVADRLRLVSAQDVYEEHATAVRHTVCIMHADNLTEPCWWVGAAGADAVCERCVALGFGG